MMERIRVAVSGAGGRMGKEVVKMVLEDETLQLVAAVDPSAGPVDAASLVGLANSGVLVTSDLEKTLRDVKPDVMVDFTTPHTVMNNTLLAIQNGVRPVIGTTGFSPEQIEELQQLSQANGLGGLIAPNFSIGAILMMRFAQQAAKYFPDLEIIEYHGEQKLDAPSGTAVKTAELVAQVREEKRQGHPNEEEKIEGSRGGYYNGFRIHSVRLPGVFAQQEVIFGGYGQSLKIRHDSYERAGYMPGVNVAVKKVMTLNELIYGFEHLLDD
ncbi:4-hydroxy-tetrahydrodipicolinate reductase [Paenibacillus sp. 481]|uniref:4-hydroxy-tetrahydrodipicolinate reductase n=1 Tax=Paenibacillus sp. 481 TaxID=2835869 RepID=UPI001E4D3A14|nr:4-hydroxy-tetrahydrodipicolinate reductase [Paenibacillus sp. 481]UHA72988.1 4-hydroxy-tetrahydrodipicolinate reductase [Paenibacillus sp. 481]